MDLCVDCAEDPDGRLFNLTLCNWQPSNRKSAADEWRCGVPGHYSQPLSLHNLGNMINSGESSLVNLLAPGWTRLIHNWTSLGLFKITDPKWTGNVYLIICPCLINKANWYIRPTADFLLLLNLIYKRNNWRVLPRLWVLLPALVWATSRP